MTLRADGSYSFEPGTAYNGLDVGETATETIEYTVSDGNGGFDTALLVISITGANDTPVVMGVTFVIACLVVLFNLIADILYGWLDPRIAFR